MLQKQFIGGCVGNTTWKREDKWYENMSDSGSGDNDVKLLWDVNLQCDDVF